MELLRAPPTNWVSSLFNPGANLPIDKLIKTKPAYLRKFIKDEQKLDFLLQEIEEHKQNLSGDSVTVHALGHDHVYLNSVSIESESASVNHQPTASSPVSSASQSAAAESSMHETSDQPLAALATDQNGDLQTSQAKRKRVNKFNFHIEHFSDLEFVKDNDKNNVEKFAARVKKLKTEHGISDLNSHKGQLQTNLGYLACKFPFIIKPSQEDATGVDYIKDKALASLNNNKAYTKRKNDSAKKKKKSLALDKENAGSEDIQQNLNLD